MRHQMGGMQTKLYIRSSKHQPMPIRVTPAMQMREGYILRFESEESDAQLWLSEEHVHEVIRALTEALKQVVPTP